MRTYIENLLNVLVGFKFKITQNYHRSSGSWFAVRVEKSAFSQSLYFMRYIILYIYVYIQYIYSMYIQYMHTHICIL